MATVATARCTCCFVVSPRATRADWYASRVAHDPLRRLALVAVVLAATGCGEVATSRAPATSGAAAAATASGFDELRSGRYHSKRFELSLELPGGKQWTVDDHDGADLVAVHAPTSSRLTLRVLALGELANRRRCEIEARSRSLVPAKLAVLDESDQGGPPGFDTRVIVGVVPRDEAAAPGPPLRGHVLAFAAKLRRCLVFDFTAEVPAGAEATLGDRLAIATVSILPTVELDPAFTEADAPVPLAPSPLESPRP